MEVKSWPSTVMETRIACSVTKNASFCCCMSIESYTEILIAERLKPSAETVQTEIYILRSTEYCMLLREERLAVIQTLSN
jgi:hypothetical protein